MTACLRQDLPGGVRQDITSAPTAATAAPRAALPSHHPERDQGLAVLAQSLEPVRAAVCSSAGACPVLSTRRAKPAVTANALRTEDIRYQLERKVSP